LRKLLTLIFVLITLPAAYSLDECKSVIEKSDIPCRITSTWNYTAPCTNHYAIVYNETGSNIINFTFSSYGSSGLCNFTWNVTGLGTYNYEIDTGDTGIVIVEAENLILALVIGIGIIVAILYWLAFALEEEHFILKVFLIVSGITLLTIIPATYITHDTSVVFHKFYIGFYVVFWLYIISYFVFWILRYLGLIVDNQT